MFYLLLPIHIRDVVDIWLHNILKQINIIEIYIECFIKSLQSVNLPFSLFPSNHRKGGLINHFTNLSTVSSSAFVLATYNITYVNKKAKIIYVYVICADI